jgi:hypothetical protein
MPTHDLIGFGLAFVGGWGGLVSALTGLSLVGALKRGRPENDQIPVAIVAWADFEWVLRNAPFPYRGLWKEYRKRYPRSRLYFWHVAGIVWGVSSVIAAMFFIWR